MAFKLASLLPREEKFYRMIDELSGYANGSARLLEKFLASSEPSARKQYAEHIIETKNESKALHTQLTGEVCRTFITPFDREDIQAFSLTLYNIPKLIEKIQDRLMTHDLHCFQGDFSRMAEIIALQAEAMEAVIQLLNKGRKLKELNEKAATLDELEDRCDQLLGRTISDAFRDVSDTRELILRKDIYEMLEDVTDFYRDCANLALRIVLKHS